MKYDQVKLLKAIESLGKEADSLNAEGMNVQTVIAAIFCLGVAKIRRVVPGDFQAKSMARLFLDTAIAATAPTEVSALDQEHTDASA